MTVKFHDLSESDKVDELHKLLDLLGIPTHLSCECHNGQEMHFYDRIFVALAEQYVASKVNEQIVDIFNQAMAMAEAPKKEDLH